MAYQSVNPFTLSLSKGGPRNLQAWRYDLQFVKKSLPVASQSVPFFSLGTERSWAMLRQAQHERNAWIGIYRQASSCASPKNLAFPLESIYLSSAMKIT
jgi:hypothetical protein